MKIFGCWHVWFNFRSKGKMMLYKCFKKKIVKSSISYFNTETSKNIKQFYSPYYDAYSDPETRLIKALLSEMFKKES